MSSTIPLITTLVINEQEDLCQLWQRIIDMAPAMSCPAYALDSDEALRLIAEIKPDVVLVDAALPGIGGVEATRKILKKEPDTLVIVYSPYEDKKEEAYTAGAVEYLIQPIAPERLTQTIRRVYKEYSRT